MKEITLTETVFEDGSKECRLEETLALWRTDPEERCPYCGVAPFKQEQIHGHYLCVACRTVTTGCCDGSTE